MKYFIDTLDRTKGSWPAGEVSEAEFIEIYRRAHDKLRLPFDSITEVRRVTGVDLRPEPTKAEE